MTSENEENKQQPQPKNLKRSVQSFTSVSQCVVYVQSQEDSRDKLSILCDPKPTFTLERSPREVTLCKRLYASGSKDKEEEQKFPVDGCTIGPPAVDMHLYLKEFHSLQSKASSLVVDLGINASVWLLGKHGDGLHNSMLFSEKHGRDLFRSALDDLFHRLESSVNSSQDYLRLKWSVHIKCFEVVGDQIIDLFAPPSQSVSNNVKVRDHPQHGTTLLGVSRHQFKSSKSAYEALKQSFQKRLILIAETSVEGTANLFGERVLGTVGCVFVSIEVNQTMYPLECICSDQSSFDPTVSFKHTTTLQYNVIAELDALSFKPSKLDKVQIVPLSEFLSPGTKKSTEFPSAKSSIGPNILANCHKSLSTLSRVLLLLHAQKGISKKVSVEDSISDPLPFIPYRESTLTRVLQPSLEGNYCNHTFLCISNESNASISHSLRLAMELRGNLQRIKSEKLAALSGSTTKSLDSEKLSDNETQGRFVGQGRRQSASSISRSTASALKLSLDNEESGTVLAEETVDTEESLSKQFWEALQLLQGDQNSFYRSYEELQALEQERRNVFKQLGVRPDDIDRSSTNMQIALPRNRNMNVELPSSLVTSGDARQEAGKTRTTSFDDSVFGSDSLQLKPNDDGNNDDEGYNDGPQPQREQVSSPKDEEPWRESDTNEGNAASLYSSASSRPIPQPLMTGAVVVSKALGGLEAASSSSIQFPTAFNGSFPPCEPPRRLLSRRESTETAQTSDSKYDHIDFLQLSCDTSNIHLQDPSSFINVCEHHAQMMSKNKMASNKKSPKLNRKQSSMSSPSCSSAVTGKNIWSPLRAPQPPSKKRAPHPSPSSPPKDASKEDNAGPSSPSSSSVITIPDLGLQDSNMKSMIRSNRLVLSPEKRQVSDPVALPSLALGLDSGSSTEELESTPTRMRVAVSKNSGLHYRQASTLGDFESTAESFLSESENALLRAVSHSNLSEVKKLISSGVNIHAKNSFERDALQIAVRNGDLRTAKYLVQNGAHKHTRGKRGDTVFHIAAGYGHIKILRWLVGEGMMHSLLDMHGQSAAHVAARRGEVEVLQYLADLGLDLMQQDFEGMTPLQHVPKVAILGNKDSLDATRRFLLSIHEQN